MKNYILTAFFAMLVLTGAYGQIMNPRHSRTFIQPRFHSQPRTYVPQKSIMFRRSSPGYVVVPVYRSNYYVDPLKAWGAVFIPIGILGGLGTVSYHLNYYVWNNPCGCTPYNPYANATIITGYSVSAAFIIAGSVMVWASNHRGWTKAGGTKYRKGSIRYWRNLQNSSSLPLDTLQFQPILQIDSVQFRS